MPPQRESPSSPPPTTPLSSSILKSSPSTPTPTPAPPPSSNQHLLLLLLSLDTLSASLLVPLLSTYYTSPSLQFTPKTIEFLNSLFSASQIVGCSLLGVALDTKYVEKKTALYVSFFGTFISYFLLLYSLTMNEHSIITSYITPLTIVIISRITVGVTKQTISLITTEILSSPSSTMSDNTSSLANISSMVTATWIVGPSAGNYIYKIDEVFPIYLSLGIVALCIVISFTMLSTSSQVTGKEGKESDSSSSSPTSSFFETIKQTPVKLIVTMALSLITSVVIRVLSPIFTPNYYKSRFDPSSSSDLSDAASSSSSSSNIIIATAPYTYLNVVLTKGYLLSYLSLLTFLTQLTLTKRYLYYITGFTRNKLHPMLFIISVQTLILFIEIQTTSTSNINTEISHFASPQTYLLLSLPLQLLQNQTLTLSLKTLLIALTPPLLKYRISSLTDVLYSGVNVVIPVIRVFVYGVTGVGGLDGGVDVVMWGWVSVVVWAGLGVVYWVCGVVLGDGDVEEKEKVKLGKVD